MNPRTSLVTGGTGGLGQAVVARFLRRGDRVLVPWIGREGADALRERLEGAETGSSARLVLMEGDVNDAGWLRELRARLEGEGEGRLDVLCNLVGGFAAGALRETDLAVWDRMMALNARSVFGVTRAVAGPLERSGRGRVVNMAALPAVTRRGDGMAAYTASKAAVMALTRALSRELRPAGVTVNAIAPSVIDTAANREAMPDADATRWVAPAEIAALMDFLTGDEGGAVTGNVVVMER